MNCLTLKGQMCSVSRYYNFTFFPYYAMMSLLLKLCPKILQLSAVPIGLENDSAQFGKWLSLGHHQRWSLWLDVMSAHPSCSITFLCLMFHFYLQPVSGQHDGNLMWQKSLSWIYPKSSAANVLVQKAFPSLDIKGNFIVSSAYLPHFFTYFCPRWKGFGLEGWGKEGHPANSSIRKGIYGIYQKIFHLIYLELQEMELTTNSITKNFMGRSGHSLVFGG